jgi:hypothetical protein
VEGEAAIRGNYRAKLIGKLCQSNQDRATGYLNCCTLSEQDKAAANGVSEIAELHNFIILASLREITVSPV